MKKLKEGPRTDCGQAGGTISPSRLSLPRISQEEGMPLCFGYCPRNLTLDVLWKMDGWMVANALKHSCYRSWRIR